MAPHGRASSAGQVEIGPTAFIAREVVGDHAVALRLEVGIADRVRPAGRADRLSKSRSAPRGRSRVCAVAVDERLLEVGRVTSMELAWSVSQACGAGGRAIMRLVVLPRSARRPSVRDAYDTVAEDYAAHLPDTCAEAPLDLAVIDAR